jgi:nitrate reductase cytochrome c-type subunit
MLPLTVESVRVRPPLPMVPRSLRGVKLTDNGNREIRCDQTSGGLKALMPKGISHQSSRLSIKA